MILTKSVKHIGLVLAVTLVCLFAAPSLTVSADTTLPEEFYGNISINGLAAPAGTVIVAKIGGVERGSFTTTEAGKYGGSGTFDSRLVVAGEEAEIGETITFWVNGYQANQTAVYEPGLSRQLNLSAQAYPLTAGDTQITKALNYLRGEQQADGRIAAFATSAWAVMAIAAAGEDPHAWTAGGASIVDYLRDNANHLDSNKATDWERSILSIVAAGENPRNFGGIDYVSTLLGFYDGTQMGDNTMLNDDFWGILALVAIGESPAIIQNMKTFIIGSQNADGGWGWTIGGNSDADNTAAAVSALVAAGESPSSQAITNALNYLKAQQQNNGGFVSEGTTNAAVDSWVINAITNVGQNPVGDEWRKSGNNPIGHLLSLQDTDGAFKWTASLSSNPEWMTAYAIPALLGKPYPVAIMAPPPSGGGGGGGGGGISSGSSPGTTDVSDIVTSDGVFTEGITAQSKDENCVLTIDADTKGLIEDEEPLDEITLIEMEDPPDPPEESSVVGLTYDFGPDGATFDPPITLTFTYDPSLIPEGVNEENLVIAMWNKTTGEWVVLEGCTVDLDSHTISAPVSHFTAFSSLAYTRPSAFTVSSLTITPSEVNIGESAAISVLITNTGDLTGSYEVSLEINNTVVETKEVTLAGGDSEPVSFSITKDTAGEYTVNVGGLLGTFEVRTPQAAFSISDLSVSPAEIQVGENVNISVSVANTGDITGTYGVTLEINNVVVETREVTLASGDSKMIAFTTTEDTVGTYTVNIDGLSDSFVVKEAAPPALSPQSSAKPINWPILSGVIAGVIIVGLLIFFVARRTYY